MKLLVIDPYVTASTPTMRSWLGAFPQFEDLFTSIEIWASKCDLEETGKVTWRRFPQRFPMWSLHALDFQRRVFAKMKNTVGTPDTLVFTTGCNAPVADIRYIHYWNTAMLEEQRKRPDSFKLRTHHKLVAKAVAGTERETVGNPSSTGWWWSVSRSISERIKGEGAGGEFRTLPNPYDPARFNPSTRILWRDTMRSHWGIGDGEIVFVFSSFGHFERKGLPQAAETLTLLQKEGHPVRFLVLGGSPASIRRFKSHARSSDAIDLGICIFAGIVTDIERHLSAGDALIFPSHFEAFSLSEIEAAALGLRLYLTPHYGSEMILREPENGRLLPWDTFGMADAISRDIVDGRLSKTHSQMGEAIDADRYAEQVRHLFLEAIDAKANG